MLGVTKKTPNCLVYSELERYPFSLYASLRAVKYWIKILYMEEDRLPRLSYQRELLEENKKHNWAKSIKNILDINGMGYIWINQWVDYPNKFIKELEQRMKDIYDQERHN